MSDNITDFPVRDDQGDLVLVCECGCLTMYVHANGNVECSSCGLLLDGNVKAYKTEEVDILNDADNLRERHVDATVDLAFKRTISNASHDESAAVFVFNKDGAVYSWHIGAADEEQRGWYRSRLADLMGKFAEVGG